MFGMTTSGKAAGHYRRFKAYDYSRGAALFITFGVSSRPKVFGRVDETGKLDYSPAGKAALGCLAQEARRGHGVEVLRSVIMPDHVHVRVYLQPGLEKPLARLAQFVTNFKRWTKYECAKLGVVVEWEKGYHDRLCLSREIIDLADKYIDNNPLKWHLMHGNPPPLKVVEPIDSLRLPGDEWWSGVGTVTLMDVAQQVCSVRLSRKIAPRDFSKVIARIEGAADKGYVLAGTWISPCERAVAEALIARGAPMIRAVPDPLAMVYRPKGDEPGQFASGRLLLLSRVAAPGVSRYDAWHGINAALDDFALSGAGCALYVRPDETGRPRFDFRSATAGAAVGSPVCFGLNGLAARRPRACRASPQGAVD